MPLKIILDSNFFFVPIQYHVDILEEMKRITNRKIEPILVSPVYEELKKLSQNSGIQGRQATVALKFAEKFPLTNFEIKPNETIDDLILRLAVKWKCPVATNDRALRRRLKEINITVIYLRQKSHLEIDGQVY